MNPNAYDQAKHYVSEMERTYAAFQVSPSPGTNTREWIKKMAEARRPEIEARHKLALEPQTWTHEEQDALVQIIVSSEEPSWQRQFAMDAIAICHMTRHAELLAGMMEDVNYDPAMRSSGSGHK